MGRLIKFGCVGTLTLTGLVVVLVVGVAALSGGGRSDTASKPTASADKAGAQAKDKPAAPAKSADGNRGITFGQPVALGQQQVGVLVTNTTDQVKSFTVKATYKQGDNIAATASGAVNDLRPGQKRAAILLSQSAVPNDAEVRVEVDTMVQEARSTPGSQVAEKVRFGNPSVKPGQFATVDVEVTNDDSAEHSFTVQMAFLKGGELVGVASGAVNDIAPGQTKTASLLASGRISEADERQLAIDTVVE